MALSGHKSVQMVLRYTKLNNAHKLRALERLEAKIGFSGRNQMSQHEEMTGTVGGTVTELEPIFQEI